MVVDMFNSLRFKIVERTINLADRKSFYLFIHLKKIEKEVFFKKEKTKDRET